jgi:hypothetical protein
MHKASVGSGLLPWGAAVGLLLACNGGGSGDGDASAGTSGGIDLTTSLETTETPEESSSSGTGSGSSGSGSESGCADAQVMIEPETPTIVLLVDQSGSMTEEFGDTDRWSAIYDTLMDPADGVIPPKQDKVRFGLTLYTSHDGNEGGVCPILTEVAPALDNFDAMDGVFAPAGPDDETPTGESLQAVATALDAFAEPGPKAIVLATDGEPDTCAEPNPQNGQEESLAAAQAAYALGIKTFVLSVGSDVGEEHLQQMANAGIGLDPEDTNEAPYWVALDAGDLADAFDEIVGGFVSCTFEVNGIVDLDDICEGTVEVDGMPLECPVDWQMPDDQHIEIIGDACEALRDGQSHTVSADFPCGSVFIP